MNPLKVLVVDDDPDILAIVAHAFRSVNAEVCTASSGLEGMRLLFSERPDLVILDILMPEMDGWEVCRQIRSFTDIPVILLTALINDEDIVHGLEIGADDFVTKPFSPEVLLARARAVLRRSEPVREEDPAAVYQDNRLLIDLLNYQVRVNGEPVKLTPIAYRLLAYLVKNAGRICTFEQILKNVWGWEYRDSLNYVHVYVSHIRQRIEEDPKNPVYIVSEFGVGYRFVKQLYRS